MLCSYFLNRTKASISKSCFDTTVNPFHAVTETIVNFHMALDFKFEYDLLAAHLASRALGILKVVVKW